VNEMHTLRRLLRTAPKLTLYASVYLMSPAHATKFSFTWCTTCSPEQCAVADALNKYHC
jgi:hypothetical protein